MRGQICIAGLIIISLLLILILLSIPKQEMTYTDLERFELMRNAMVKIVEQAAAHATKELIVDESYIISGLSEKSYDISSDLSERIKYYVEYVSKVSSKVYPELRCIKDVDVNRYSVSAVVKNYENAYTKEVSISVSYGFRCPYLRGNERIVYVINTTAKCTLAEEEKKEKEKLGIFGGLKLVANVSSAKSISESELPLRPVRHVRVDAYLYVVTGGQVTHRQRLWKDVDMYSPNGTYTMRILIPPEYNPKNAELYEKYVGKGSVYVVTVISTSEGTSTWVVVNITKLTKLAKPSEK